MSAIFFVHRPPRNLYFILLNLFLHSGHVFSHFLAQASMHSKQNLWSQQFIVATSSDLISSMHIGHLSASFGSILRMDSLFDSTYYCNLLATEFFDYFCISSAAAPLDLLVKAEGPIMVIGGAFRSLSSSMPLFLDSEREALGLFLSLFSDVSLTDYFELICRGIFGYFL